MTTKLEKSLPHGLFEDSNKDNRTPMLNHEIKDLRAYVLLALIPLFAETPASSADLHDHQSSARYTYLEEQVAVFV